MATNYLTTNRSGSGSVDYAIAEEGLATALGTLSESLVVTGLISNRSAEARAIGGGYNQTVRVPVLPNVTSALKTPGTPVSGSSFAMAEGVDIVLNKHRIVDFIVEDYGALFAPGYLADLGREAAKTIAQDIDADVIALYADAGVTVGTSGAGLDDALVRETLRTTKTQLFRSTEPTNFIFGAYGLEDVMAINKFVLANESGATNALNNGVFGRKYGMDFYYSSQTPYITNTPSYEIGMVFQREAMAIAMIDMATNVPMGDLAPTYTQVMDYTDDLGNPIYSMRMEIGRDLSNKGFRVQFDTIYGVKVVRDALLIRVNY